MAVCGETTLGPFSSTSSSETSSEESTSVFMSDVRREHE
jgi:hypothetical protein